MSAKRGGTGIDDILTQIRSCLDAATSRPGLVKASVYQTEGYLRGHQGLPWERQAAATPSPEDSAALFLHEIRRGAIALRGRIKKASTASGKAFISAFRETFPEAGKKPFLSAVGRLWIRWSETRTEKTTRTSMPATARRLGQILKQEYEEGVAGGLSAYILDDRLHLRRVRDFLHMRGWLQGTIENLRRRSDWESRERAEILSSNLSSIVLRALHNADTDYAAAVVARLPEMIRDLNREIETLATTDREAEYFLRNNRLTIFTHALHSGYLDYNERAAKELPPALKKLNEKIGRMESSSPDAARSLRAGVASAVYKALTNGSLDKLK